MDPLKSIPAVLTDDERLQLAALDCAFYGYAGLEGAKITPWRAWWHLGLADKVRHMFFAGPLEDAIAWCVRKGYVRMRPDGRGMIVLNGLEARDLYRPWPGRTWLVSPGSGSRS